MIRSRRLRLWATALPLVVILTGCGAELHRDTDPLWDSAAWREQMRSHADGVEPLLPLLTEIRAATDPARYRDTLRLVYDRLRAAEDSIPPVAAWKADISNAEIASRYREAIRELRYGAEVMLDGIERQDDRWREDARRFLAEGLQHFRDVRARMEPVSREPPEDTAAAARLQSFLISRGNSDKVRQHSSVSARYAYPVPSADGPSTGGPGRSATWYSHTVLTVARS